MCARTETDGWLGRVTARQRMPGQQDLGGKTHCTLRRERAFVDATGVRRYLPLLSVVEVADLPAHTAEAGILSFRPVIEGWPFEVSTSTDQVSRAGGNPEPRDGPSMDDALLRRRNALLGSPSLRPLFL